MEEWPPCWPRWRLHTKLLQNSLFWGGGCRDKSYFLILSISQRKWGSRGNMDWLRLSVGLLRFSRPRLSLFPRLSLQRRILKYTVLNNISLFCSGMGDCISPRAPLTLDPEKEWVHSRPANGENIYRTLPTHERRSGITPVSEGVEWGSDVPTTCPLVSPWRKPSFRNKHT